jgi:hypothetical protein
MLSRTLLASLAIGALAAASRSAPQCPPDAFEPNDDCAQAALLPAGSQLGLTIGDQELDVFRIDVPAGQRMELSIAFAQPDPNQVAFLLLFLDDGSTPLCSGFDDVVASAEFNSTQTVNQVVWSAPKTAPATFFAQLQSFDSFGGGCAAYDLSVSIQPDPCAAIPDDPFEPNDTCATAAPLGVGTFAGLNAGIADPDHFRLTLAPKEVLTIALSGLVTGETVSLLAWDPNNACGDSNAVVAGGVAFGPSTGGFHLANTSTVTRDFVVRVVPELDQITGLSFCVSYSLTATSEIDPCGAITGDAFDPNSSCFTASLLSSTQTDLKAHANDQDWFSIDVPARSTLRLRSKSTANLTVGPMMLWSGCGGNPDFLASSQPWLFDPTDPRHFLSWHNAENFVTNTRLFMTTNTMQFPKPYCDTYQLEFEITHGKTFCILTKNSSGDAALLSASGSTQVGLGTLELSAAPVPPNSVGLVFFGPTTKPATPFGGGFLCVQGPLLRLPGSFTGPQGVLATTIDWTGTASVLAAGQSVAFQAWFRDAAATPNFNLSDGLEIAFQ